MKVRVLEAACLALVLSFPSMSAAQDDMVSRSGELRYGTPFGYVDCHWQATSTDSVHADGRIVASALPVADETGELDGCELWGQRVNDFYLRFRHQQYNPNLGGWVTINSVNLPYGSSYTFDQTTPSWAGRDVKLQFQSCHVNDGCLSWVTVYQS